jgi:hypothetical protein
MNHSEAQEAVKSYPDTCKPLLPAPEHALHTGNPEDLGYRETGIAITLQVFSSGYREILAIKPVQMVPYRIVISAGFTLESTPRYQRPCNSFVGKRAYILRSDKKPAVIQQGIAGTGSLVASPDGKIVVTLDGRDHVKPAVCDCREIGSSAPAGKGIPALLKVLYGFLKHRFRRVRDEEFRIRKNDLCFPDK